MDARLPARPVLRLVTDQRRPHPTTLPERNARASVETENHAAAAMDPDDARWAFAVRVAHLLDSGASGALSPEKRSRLMTTARQLGLRQFDASLVIAIVQDSARTGLGPLGPSVEPRLRLIREPQRETSGRREIVYLLLAAVTLATAIFILARAWLIG